MQEASDLFSIFAAVALLTGGLLAWSWCLVGRAPHMLAWASANLLIGMARLFFGFADTLPPGVVLAFGTATLLTAVTLLWTGARLLRGAPAPAWIVIAPGLLWSLACLWPPFTASPRLQLFGSALVAALITLLFGWEMLRLCNRGLARVLSRLIAAMAVLYALSHLAKFVTPPGPGSLAITAPNVLAGGPLFLAIGLLGLALGYLESAERAARIQAHARLREAQLRAEAASREAAAQRLGRAEVERLHRTLPVVIFRGFRKPDGSIGRLYRAGDLPAVLGWSRAELDAMETVEPLSDFGDTSLPEFFTGALRAGSRQCDWRLRQPDGSWAWMRTIALRFEGGDAREGEFIGYSFNIARERDAEARALVAARLASLGEMAAGLAHELRQPLQAISLAAEAAQIGARRMAAVELDAELEQVVVEAHAASALMDHLRRFARGADAQAEAEDIPLDQAIEAAVSLAGEALRRAGITVETRCDSPAPKVQGQTLAVEQMLTNLLLHARDAMPEAAAGAARRLEITARNGRDGTARLVFTIPRLGTGAASPGHNMAGIGKPPGLGGGLGLSISQSLVNAMQGSLLATESAEATIFTVTLPAAPVQALSA